jgi:hypothetical protein
MSRGILRVHQDCGVDTHGSSDGVGFADAQFGLNELDHLAIAFAEGDRGMKRILAER